MSLTPGQAAIVTTLYKEGEDITRESYIAHNWAGLDVSDWTAENEAELPEELQDWSLFRYDQERDRFTYIGPS